MPLNLRQKNVIQQKKHPRFECRYGENRSFFIEIKWNVNFKIFTKSVSMI